MKKLLSTAEFVLWLGNDNNHRKPIFPTLWKSTIIIYANIMLRKPELWMFVPCDKEGNVLEKPDYEDCKQYENPQRTFEGRERKFQQAQERCWFEGWKINGAGEIVHGNFEAEFHEYKGETWLQWEESGYESKTASTIEDIAKQIDLTHSKTLLKEIGLNK